MAKDYYQILGVERTASQAEIKKAYRKLSKELHPDKHKGDKAAEDRFKEVNEAYEVLNDPQKKQAYDQFGTTGGQGFGGFDFSGFQGGQYAGGFSDIFESFFGGQRGGPRAPTRGEDLEVSLEVPFTVAVTGQKQTIKVPKFVSCSDCSGEGFAKGSKRVSCKECGGTGQVTKQQQSFFGMIQQSFVCPTCRGSGQVPEKPCSKCSGEGRLKESATLTIEVPAGIQNGQTLRLTEQGHAGLQGTPAGDLYVHIRVTPDSRFNRDGHDIRTTVKINVLDAILGTTISVETVHGPVELKIPAGLQPGQILRIKGKGMPILNSAKTGDHFVTVQVEVPKKLSRKEKELMEKWRKL